MFPLVRRSRLTASASEYQTAYAATITYASDGQLDNDVSMNAIQISLAALQEGSALAANFPYVAPIAGLLLHALTMRDASEVKQYKEECELMMRKVARVASIIVNICGKYNLKEEDLPAGLLATMGSLRRELDKIERVLKHCSKKQGIGRLLLRKDLLTKIKQCDGELSNVLQAFQAELSLDTRFALIVERREWSAAFRLADGVQPWRGSGRATVVFATPPTQPNRQSSWAGVDALICLLAIDRRQWRQIPTGRRICIRLCRRGSGPTRSPLHPHRLPDAAA
ncbi:hypothetical protein V8E53_009897 [Lactarius tabidus]